MEKLPEVYIGYDTSPSKIIPQLQQNFQKEMKDVEVQIRHIENQKENDKNIYEEAFHRWCRQKYEHDQRLSILRNRKNELGMKNLKKVKLYLLLDKYDPGWCVNAYRMAENATRSEIEQIKIDPEDESEDMITKRIAVDLFNGNYVLFPSEEAEDWYTVAHMMMSHRNQMPPPRIL